ncbi:hypothetical protein SBA3_430051 [Candidatus Sulfopaludibacter sp. SbA3]|nr:hypothetical protein SBA3_430051 [Candidatus Sulfopaludibacter sp. SbA3]
MLTHDPFQMYQNPGAYSTGVTPFGLPYTAVQPFVNPAIGGYGIHPQHLHGLGFAGLGQAWQNPLLQQQLLQQQLLQQLQQQQLQQPLLNPMAALQGWPQTQSPFGYPLAPQSLIGATGIGQPTGQIHPLAQLALRQAAGYGISPLAGCF